MIKIDINKLRKSDCINVPYLGSYWGAIVVGISKKHNTVTVDIGDYARLYHIPIEECKPHDDFIFKKENKGVASNE